MTALVKRYPLLAFYLLTFAISWSGFVLAVGPGALLNADWRAEGSLLPVVAAMLAGPSVAGLLLTGLIDGRGGHRDLFARLRCWDVPARWYAVAILPAPVVAAAVMFALSLRWPLLTADNKMAIVLGGLGAGEIPLPWFVILSASAAIASLTAYRVLMVWLHDRTGSLFVTTLMHGMLTASTIFWFTPIATGPAFLADEWLVAAVMWLGAGAVAIGVSRRRFRT